MENSEGLGSDSFIFSSSFDGSVNRYMPTFIYFFLLGHLMAIYVMHVQ